MFHNKINQIRNIRNILLEHHVFIDFAIFKPNLFILLLKHSNFSELIYKYTKKIPLINFLPIKLTGKTDTINAMQYIKNITGKSWLIAFTNTPSWGDGTARPSGKPPGTPLAKTNRYGEITGWS